MAALPVQQLPSAHVIPMRSRSEKSAHSEQNLRQIFFCESVQACLCLPEGASRKQDRKCQDRRQEIWGAFSHQGKDDKEYAQCVKKYNQAFCWDQRPGRQVQHGFPICAADHLRADPLRRIESETGMRKAHNNMYRVVLRRRKIKAFQIAHTYLRLAV